MEVKLRTMTAGREVVEDYSAVSLSLRGHPVAFLREELARRRIVRCADLARIIRHSDSGCGEGVLERLLAHRVNDCLRVVLQEPRCHRVHRVQHLLAACRNPQSSQLGDVCLRRARGVVGEEQDPAVERDERVDQSLRAGQQLASKVDGSIQIEDVPVEQRVRTSQRVQVFEFRLRRHEPFVSSLNRRHRGCSSSPVSIHTGLWGRCTMCMHMCAVAANSVDSVVSAFVA